MLSVLSGLAVTGGAGAAVWYLKPRNGQVHPLAVAPVLEWLIPIAIVSALSLGIALVVSGAASF
jgi:hypothetical protein